MGGQYTGTVYANNFNGGTNSFDYITISALSSSDALSKLDDPASRTFIASATEHTFTSLGNDTYYVAIMDTNGDKGVSNSVIVSCFDPATPTPTPTPTSTPVPPTNTPTPTPTPTPDPNFYYEADRYECLIDGSCSFVETIIISNPTEIVINTNRYRLDPTTGYIFVVHTSVVPQVALITSMVGFGSLNCRSFCTQPPTATPTSTPIPPTATPTPTPTSTPTPTPTSTPVPPTPTSTDVPPDPTPTPSPTETTYYYTANQYYSDGTCGLYANNVVILSSFSVPNQTWVCGDDNYMYYIVEPTLPQSTSVEIISTKNDCTEGCGG